MDDEREDVSKGINEFAFILYNEVRKDPGNVLISPMNMSLGLIIAWAGCEGTTATQISKALKLTSMDMDRAVLGMEKLLESLQDAKNVDLLLLNKVYANRAVRIKKPFKEVCVNRFKGDAEEVDFKVTDAARNSINTWMEKFSKGAFKEILEADIIKEDTKLLFVNAAYFKAAWMNLFEEASTQLGTFTTDDGTTIEVPMLHGNFQLKYHNLPLIAATAVTVSFADESFETLFILPNGENDMNTTEEKLGDVDYTDLPSSVMEVYLTLPKFKLEKANLMKTALIQTGVKDLFQKKADVSNITTEPIFAQDFVHKLFFEICEQGTCEGVKAADHRVRKSVCEPVEFTVDRPFVFLVKRGADMLFIGRVSNPQ